VAAFLSKSARSNFPFDVGDDPSFFSAQHLDGPVTWGVCRADVRHAISPGDWAVFFAARPRAEDSDTIEYRLRRRYA
jgi:hypothetical protein